jgi:transmembrane sensor
MRGTQRKLRHRRRVRALTFVASALLLVGAVVVGWKRSEAPVSTPAEMVARVEVASSGEVQIHGSSDVRTVRLDAHETVLELRSGAARFSAEKQVGRRLRVLVGAVRIEVVGTVFVVERRAAGVRVNVEEGRVQVFVGDVLQRVVSAEETVVFDLANVEASSTAEAVPPSSSTEVGAEAEVVMDPGLADAPRLPPAKSPSKKRRGKGLSPAPKEWRALAAVGEFQDAWDAMQREKPKDEPEDLLRAADVARRSGHPKEAVAPLERVISAFARDARAPLAAFTLGRVLLEDLSAPGPAAQAFAKAQVLAPSGPLALSALAREVEARAKANDFERARECARAYLDRAPDGPHARSVKEWGRLSDR